MVSNGLNLDKDNPATVLFQDEGRFGRINNVGDCWGSARSRAMVKQQLVREYTYAYTAVCPGSGATTSLILPYSNTESMSLFLEEVARDYHGSNVLLFLDGASWHRGENLVVPQNIKLIRIPPYSPELNPVENIWDYIREQKGFNNYIFDSMDDVEDRLSTVLKNLNSDKDYLKSMCNFKWMIKATC